MAKKSLFAIDLEEDVFEKKPKEENKPIEPQVNKQGVKYCDKCKAQVISSAKFCGECGNRSFVDNLEELSIKYCANCGAKLDASIKYCFDCGKNEFVKSYDEYEKIQKEKEFIPYMNEIKENEKVLEDLKAQIKIKQKEVDDVETQYAYLLMEKPVAKELPKEFKGDIVEERKLLTEINQLEQKVKIEKIKLSSAQDDDESEFERRMYRINHYSSLINKAKKAIDDIEASIDRLERGI